MLFDVVLFLIDGHRGWNKADTDLYDKYLKNRNDIGALWENFVFMERMKKHSYEDYYGEHYFWRTYQGQEIDLVENINTTVYVYNNNILEEYCVIF